MTTCKEAEKSWAGKLGDDYFVRNNTNGKSLEYVSRQKFWYRLLDGKKGTKKIKESFPRTGIYKILEVGCGSGEHLAQIPSGPLYGIDVNEKSLKYAKEKWGKYGSNIIYGSALDIPFKDNYFDLVFTCGLLIHIPPDGLLKAMSEIVRCSKKYVLCIEYTFETERERPFLGEMGITWERPYKNMYQNNFNLLTIEKGFLTKKDGFNDLNYFMLEKII